MKTLSTINDLAIWIQDNMLSLPQKKQATIITLSGDLGDSKTALVQELAKQLGIIEPITSPTFVIQKEYTVSSHAWVRRLVHIDAYRLENKTDLEHLGWNVIIDDPETLICFEWPEKVSGIELPDVLRIKLQLNSDHTRTISFI